jgi:lipoprotein-anchoring transpeptidase ErfK/SrfK
MEKNTQAELALFLELARQALQAGNKPDARLWAGRALWLAPGTVEAWLILAQVGSPRASRVYLEQARSLQPDNPDVQAALMLSQLRFIQESTEKTRPMRTLRASVAQVPRSQKKICLSMRMVMTVTVVLAVCLFVLVFSLAWKGSLSSASAAIRQDLSPSSLVVEINHLENSTASPTPTQLPTQTPSPSPTPLPTETATPLPSRTPTPTSSPTPTLTPRPTQPTYIVKSGENIVEIASKLHIDLAVLEKANPQITPTRLKPGQSLYLPTANLGTKEQPKSILVDISKQHVYAYEGSQQVLDFVASTGSSNSTLAGQFTILDKIADAYSAPYGFWMPDWMGIYYVGNGVENGFHALPVLANGKTLWGDEIGQPITYGCVVLETTDMQQLYEWTEVGTRVTIQ